MGTRSTCSTEARGVSVACEIDEVMAVVAGVRYLAALVHTDHLAQDGDERLIGRAVSATLNLVGLRLRLLRRACGGSIGVDQLLEEHNVALGDENDLVLPLSAVPKKVTRGRQQQLQGGRSR